MVGRVNIVYSDFVKFKSDIILILFRVLGFSPLLRRTDFSEGALNHISVQFQKFSFRFTAKVLNFL